MDSMFVYRKIGNHLKSIYRVDPHDADQGNLVKCRAVTLTLLHHFLSEPSSNSFVSASYRDSLYELVYTATEAAVTDPFALYPTLVLHILEDELVDINLDMNAQFAEVEQRMREWFVGYRERRQISPEDYPALPELQWSDLPNELFGLMPES